jgi:predicted restriction endonuclease
LLILVLLARAQRRESNRISFREVEDLLCRSLQAFGPPTKSCNPELPFWHLQSSGFWEIENRDLLPPRAGKDRPTRAAMRKHNAVGYVPIELWQALTADQELITRLARFLLERYWPSSEHDAIVSMIGLRGLANVPAKAPPLKDICQRRPIRRS